MSPSSKHPALYVKLLYLVFGNWIGVFCRYGLTIACDANLSPTTKYPMATNRVNVLGCLVIGFATLLPKATTTGQSCSNMDPS